VANALLTTDEITREAVMLFRNSNAFIQAIDRQYDDQFGIDGAKIGDTLRIRLPNDYTVADGPALQVQDTNEQSTTIAVATQRHVDVAFTSAQRKLKLQDFSTRILAPMMNDLAGNVASTIMAGSEGGVSNFVSNVDGGGNIIAPVALTWLTAGALLDNNSAAGGRRQIVMSQFTQAKTVDSLKGLFNPTVNIGEQYRTGMVSKNTLGFENWWMDQSVINHTTGAYGASTTVNGANQTGLSITVAALPGPMKKGDVISFAGVYAVNRIMKIDTGVLAQFVLTADVAAAATVLPIYPAIVPPVGGSPVQYQTVTASPANGAAVTVSSKASERYRKNIAFAPQAVTMVTADLEMPKGVHEVAREVYDRISMRFLTDYVTLTDQFASRLDVLFGWLWVRPEWAVVVADSVP
jgi:hypothetical protein